MERQEPAFIIELKRNDSPESAIEQIKKKDYSEAVSHHKDNLFLVGIDYDPKSRSIVVR